MPLTAYPSRTVEPERVHSDYVYYYAANEASSLTAAASWKLLEQVTNISKGQGGDEDEWYTFGSGKQATVDSIDFSVNMTFLRPMAEADELHMVYGYGDLTFAKDDKFSFKQAYIAADIDDEVKLPKRVHFMAELVDKTGALKARKVWEGVKWSGIEESQDADGYNQEVFTGLATDYYEVAKPDPLI